MSAGSPSKKLGQFLRAMARRFAEAGIDTPMLDARVLVCAATGLTPETLIMQENAPIAPRALKSLQIWEAARCTGTPVSRLIGQREFFGLAFDIGPAVLDPRADTETLVEAAIGVAPKTGRVLDLGTGSGCVLISVLANTGGLRGLGVDISAGALRLARLNAHRHKVRGRIGLRQGSWFSPVRGRFDVIMSNPPYIARGEIGNLAAEVRDHDPRQALDGGLDGLDAYRHICRTAPDYLETGGHLVVEIGHNQAQQVSDLMRAEGFQNLSVEKDLEARARVVRGQIKKTKKGV